MKAAIRNPGQPTKTEPKYRGPLTISHVLPSDTYRVMSLNDADGSHKYVTTAHISQLKLWTGKNQFTEGNENEDAEKDEEVEENVEQKTEEQLQDEDGQLTMDEDTQEKTNEKHVRTRRMPRYLRDYEP